MDKLQWFKFCPSDYMMGKIQRCSEITQARFMRLCCLYWNKECNLSIQDAIIEIDQDHYDILVSKKIIKVIDDFISIDFLNEQMKNITENSKEKSRAANTRWNKYREQKLALQTNTDAMQNDASDMHMHTDAMQNDADKKREEKIREESINKASQFNFKSSLIEYGFDSNLVIQWLAVRKNKRLTNSEVAFNKFINQVELNGNDKNEILEKCIEKSWGGFESDWFKKEVKEAPKQGSYSPIKLL